MPKSTIVDVNGNPIDLAAIRQPQIDAAASKDTGAMIASIQTEYANHPARGLTPARVNAILRAAEEGDLVQLVDLADDMEERDGHIYSELAKRRTAILKFDWDILPPDDPTPEEKKQAAQVREWIMALPKFEQNVLMPLTDAIHKGFANVSQWWELEDGYLMPRHQFVLPRCFTMNQARDRITLRNNVDTYGEALRPYNWISHLHPAGPGALGRQGLCRRLILPYMYKNFSTRDFAEFLEIYGLPLRLGKYPAGASDEEKLRLLQAVVTIGHNAAGIVPLGMEIDFQNAASGTEVPFGAMIDRMDAIQSKIIVGQTLTSSEGKHGTQALGKVHEGVLTDICASDAKLIAATLTEQLVAPMQLLNLAGADPKRLARFHIEVPELEDMSALATALPGLAKAGLRIGLEWAHKKAGIPMAKPGEEILQAASEPAADPEDTDPQGEPKAAGNPKPAARKAPVRAALNAAGAAPRDALDDLVDEAAADWRPVMTPVVQPLLAALNSAIEAGETIEQFQARLPALFEKIDAKALATELALAGFSARLAGAADLDLG